ncbi:hypothetical protein D3C78_1129430 [compost metagenome]
MIALDVEELAMVTDLVHLARLRVDASLAVGQHGVVFPAAFPELVEHIEVFVGAVVAAVVFDLLPLAQGLGGAFQIAGDDVPADAPLAQVIEGGDAPGERVGRLVGEVGGDAEAQVPGGPGHGRDQHERVVHRQLDGFLGGELDAVLVDVVDAEDIGEEQAVEQPAFQQLRQLGPVAQLVELAGAVARVGPQAVVDVADAVHAEGVQKNFFLAHGWSFRRRFHGNVWHCGLPHPSPLPEGEGADWCRDECHSTRQLRTVPSP